jgi:hypothetical protein
MENYLAGGLEHEFYDFPYLGNFIIPTDELIFFRGVGINTTNQLPFLRGKSWNSMCNFPVRRLFFIARGQLIHNPETWLQNP